MSDKTMEFKNDPVKFLKTYPTECTAAGTWLKSFYLKLIYNEDFNVAQLSPTEKSETGVMIYILGWKENDVAVGKLGSEANYFFTGPLTGCTFAVDKNWYTPSVLHVNQQLKSGKMDVKSMLKTVKTRMAKCTSVKSLWLGGPNITIVQSHNRKENHKYNIWGIKGRLGWTFYQQIVKENIFDLSVKSLNKLDTFW